MQPHVVHDDFDAGAVLELVSGGWPQALSASRPVKDAILAAARSLVFRGSP